MTQYRPATTGPLRGWLDAVAAVLAGLLAMAVTAALGLWLAGASQLPGSAFPPVVAATMVMAVSGHIELSGGAGVIARSEAGLTVIPLSVSLVGALVTAAVFVRPLRFHAVLTGGELLARFARTAVLWLLALIPVGLAARHTFTISVGDSLAGQLGEIFGATPSVGFRAALPATLGLGLLWLLILLALACAVSRKAPLPTRLLHFESSVRPAARAMVLVLLAYAAIGLIGAVVTAATGTGNPDTGRIFAVVFLGLPNLAWLAFGLGLGATWDGSLKGGLGLPMPEALSSVLRSGNGDVALNLGSLSRYDGRIWLLPALAGLALLTAAFVNARRSPPGVSHLRHAMHLALAAAVTMLAIGVLTRIHAQYGLSLFGIGDASDPGGGLGGTVSLRCRLLTAVPIAAGWGAVAGFAGSVLASWPAKHR